MNGPGGPQESPPAHHQGPAAPYFREGCACNNPALLLLLTSAPLATGQVKRSPEHGGDWSNPAQLQLSLAGDFPGIPSPLPPPTLPPPASPPQSNLTFIVITSEPWTGAVPRKAAENNVMGLGRRGNSSDRDQP